MLLNTFQTDSGMRWKLLTEKVTKEIELRAEVANAIAARDRG